jgi:hypothetical protein
LAQALLDSGQALAVSFQAQKVTCGAPARDSQRVNGDRQAMENPYVGLPDATLLVEAGKLLQLNQRELAEALGVSRRTIVRWTARATSMNDIDTQQLARLVFPRNVQLAEALALEARTTLERLGLAQPAPTPTPPLPPPAPSPPMPPLARLVDIVVCAVADALDLPPRAARPALLAGVQRAKELGLKLDDVEQALAGEAKALKVRGREPAGKPPARRA